MGLAGVFFTLLFFAFLPFPAEGAVTTLYRGNAALGQTPATNGEDGYVVSVVDTGALLGLEASLAGEELLLTRGRDRLRIVPEAVAAWYNNQLIPLYGPARFRDGRWWMDVPSLLSLLQRFAGRGNDDRLRFEETTGTKTDQVPTVPAGGTPPPDPAPGKVEAPLEVIVVSAKPPEKKPAAPPPEKVPVAFTRTAAGEIRAIRWSTSREKIRAVIDCSEGSNPEMKVAAGKISMNFDRIVDGLEGLPSPYENVDAELMQGTNSVTIVFTVTDVRVEKLLLDNPRRVVLDFIFNSATAIREMPQQPVKQPETTTPTTREAPRKNGKLLVVLDPGHGGKDPGATGNGFREKDINLSIGLQMEKALKAKGLDVRMTRNTDVYLTLQERTDIANKLNADMFVSIHVNSLPPGKNSAGFEIYLMALPTDRDALALAKIENREYLGDRPANGAAADRRTELLLKILGDMQQNNKIYESTTVAEVLFRAGNAAGLPMKRVAQAPFFVLRGAGMPAVLMETGFITNAREAKLLAHPGYQQKIAEAMANGIYTYLK
ncbi:MAG: N-acetylmuramoyl-L-alanine amidase [Synergistaceae bacterium]|nr:N-acetylmuramoyl-L-alanine amidase [Synergistaceae bacterium]